MLNFGEKKKTMTIMSFNATEHITLGQNIPLSHLLLVLGY